VRQLLAAGSREITVFSPTAPCPQDGVRYAKGDILNLDQLERGLLGCTVVFHLAALTDAAESRVNPIRYLDVNAFGTACVMEACRRLGVGKVIYTSTAHVYGKPLHLPIGEEHSTEPLSLYATGKLAGEVFVRGYAASYKQTAVIARLSNLYGSSLGPATVIGRAVESVALREPIQLRSVEEIRDFIYVEDAAEALLRLAASEQTSTGLHIVNVSTGRGVSIREAVSELAAAAEDLGFPAPEILPPSGEPDHELPSLVLDNRRLRSLTGWTPQTSLRQGLTNTLKERATRQ
jgi:nucleoside-diphosphate-sugar epimerase